MRDLNDQFRRAWQVLEPLSKVEMPPWRPVRQRFPIAPAVDVETALRTQLSQPGLRGRIRPGMRVVLAVGSRGVANIALAVRVLVRELSALGAEPLIVPAMGSHGGGTPEGQVATLASLGIDSESAGAPVRSSFETVEVGRYADGTAVLVDRFAAAADAVIPVARVKAHTGFRGPVESGMVKLLTVGLGKQAGATVVHAPGMDHLAARLLEGGAAVLKGLNVPFGVAFLEGASDQTVRVEVVPGESILAREPELLGESKRLMGRLLIEDIDVLVVGELGKNVSGAGMDPNVTGRFSVPGLAGGARARKLVVLDVTAESHGNAIGMGLADIASARILDKIDLASVYLNSITSTVLNAGKIPLVAANDRAAIGLALLTCNREPAAARVVAIRNTMELESIHVSESLWRECRVSPDFEELGGPQAPVFDAAGSLIWPRNPAGDP